MQLGVQLSEDLLCGPRREVGGGDGGQLDDGVQEAPVGRVPTADGLLLDTEVQPEEGPPGEGQVAPGDQFVRQQQVDDRKETGREPVGGQGVATNDIIEQPHQRDVVLSRETLSVAAHIEQNVGDYDLYGVDGFALYGAGERAFNDREVLRQLSLQLGPVGQVPQEDTQLLVAVPFRLFCLLRGCHLCCT